jgi:hypothetical protein
MQSFLVCENSRCRMVLDLRENGRVMRRWELIIDECPECGGRWSSNCPFCGKSLEVVWRAELPHCSRCHQKLHAEAA